MKTQLSIKMKTVLGIAGIAEAGLLTRTVKGLVSLVSNKLFSPSAHKEGVCGVPKSLLPCRHLQNRRHRHDLRTAFHLHSACALAEH